MSTVENQLKKREYTIPAIQCIMLDNEISLALESTPPAGKGETQVSKPEYMNNDPYHINRA
jgi:hypothetical protein